MDRPADLLNQLRIERNAPPPPRSWRWLWITLVVLAVLAVVAFAGLKLMRGDNAQQVRVATATAIGGNHGSASVLDATGYVTARREATVSAKITGKVKEVFIEEGQRVPEGFVMATLDPVDADAQKRLSQSQLAAARSQADSVAAQLKSAEADAKRMQEMAERKLIARSQLDQSVAQRDSLRAQLAAARHNAQVASDNVRISDIGNVATGAAERGVAVTHLTMPSVRDSRKFVVIVAHYMQFCVFW